MVLEGFWTEGSIWFRRAFGRRLLEWRAFGFGGHLVQGHFFEGIWKEGFWKRAYGWRASDPESGKFMVEIAWWKMYGGKFSVGQMAGGKLSGGQMAGGQTTWGKMEEGFSVGGKWLGEFQQEANNLWANGRRQMTVSHLVQSKS